MSEQTLREVNAPYLVNPDDETIGRETIIIRRNGEPVAVMAPLTNGELVETVVTDPTGRILGGLVPPTEFTAYRAWKEMEKPPPQLDSSDAIMERGRGAFERLLPELLNAHPGEWVAIVDEQPVQFGPDFQSVIQPVRKKYGQRSVYVREILEKPRVYKMPSTRVIR